MRLRHSLCTFGMVLVILGLGGLAVSHAQQPAPRQHGRKIEESSTYSSGEAVTNLLQSSKRQDSLKRLEEELRRTLQPFAPEAEDMLTPNLGPVFNPVTRNPRPRDRKQEFLSLTAEELLMPGFPDDMRLKLSDGKTQDLDKLSLEQLYMDSVLNEQNKTKPAAKRDDPSRSRDWFGTKEKPEAQTDANLPPGIRDNQKKLKEMLGPTWSPAGLNAAAPPGTSLSDLFGLHNQPALTPEQEAAHKEYMDKYRQLLNGPTPPALAVNPLNPFPTADPSVGPSSLSPLGSLAGPTTQVGLDGTPSGFSPIAVADPTAKVLNQWNTYYAPPKLEPPARQTPVSLPMSHVPPRVF